MDTTPHLNKASSKVFSLNEENLKHLLKAANSLFPRFKHETHGSVVNVNKVADERLTMGAKIADGVAATVGSWPFIIVQSIILAAWIIFNSLAWINHWDPYPFILLNLALSFQAAYAAPFVMMSQNRQAAKDRLTAENDYKTDLKGEQELCHVMEHLDHQDALILQIVQNLEAQNQRIDHQDQLILSIVQKLETQNKLLEEQHERMFRALDTRNENNA